MESLMEFSQATPSNNVFTHLTTEPLSSIASSYALY